MRYGLLSTVAIILLIAFLMQNVYVGGLGGVVLVVALALLVTGRL